jgi:hypothetical protein
LLLCRSSSRFPPNGRRKKATGDKKKKATGDKK